MLNYCLDIKILQIRRAQVCVLEENKPVGK